MHISVRLHCIFFYYYINNVMKDEPGIDLNAVFMYALNDNYSLFMPIQRNCAALQRSDDITSRKAFQYCFYIICILLPYRDSFFNLQ